MIITDDSYSNPSFHDSNHRSDIFKKLIYEKNILGEIFSPTFLTKTQTVYKIAKNFSNIRDSEWILNYSSRHSYKKLRRMT